MMLLRGGPGMAVCGDPRGKARLEVVSKTHHVEILNAALSMLRSEC